MRAAAVRTRLFARLTHDWYCMSADQRPVQEATKLYAKGALGDQHPSKNNEEASTSDRVSQSMKSISLVNYFFKLIPSSISLFIFIL
jgi:hypothetical protein